MSAKKLVDRLRQTASFGAWIAKYDELVRDDIAVYADRVRSARPVGHVGDFEGSSKAVKDALWGMIDLNYSELVVLDSPPVQRLRRVRQLGFSYLTYPTAGYSRFEHVIGAMFQSERLLRSIERRSGAGLTQIIRDSVPVARLAALLHDAGHLPGSHLGERYYMDAECADAEMLTEIQDAISDIGSTLNVPKPALGEALSLAIILAPSMWSLLTEEAGYKPEQVAAAALAIVGAPPSVQQAFLPNVITNVIDADKLDYLFRDALVTQIPLAVDLDRLLYKLKVVQVPASRMEESLQDMAAAGGLCNVLGTDLAGYELLYDLLASRSMLFDRIYLHHKTRAAERMGLDVLDAVRAHPVDLLAHDDDMFTSPATDGGDQGQRDAGDRRRRLRQRDLPRRAFAISYQFLVAQASAPRTGQQPSLPEEVQEAFQDLVEVLEDRASRDALLAQVVIERDRLAELLAVAGPLPELWLDTQPKSHDLGDPDLFVELPDGTVTNRPSYAQKASAFTRNPMRAAYLYAAGSDLQVQIANIAAELVIFERHQLDLGRAAADYAKVDYEAVCELKRGLEAVDQQFFQNAGQLRPRSALAARERGRTRIEALVSKFHAYNVGDSQENPSMSASHVQSFLDQFPERLVGPMLAVLDGVTFLTRDDMGRRFVATLGETENVRQNVTAFPLTSNPEKSAASLGTYFADSPDRPHLRGDIVPAIQAIDAGESTELVAIDDFCLSGSQAATMVQVWMGMPNPVLPEEAHLATALSPDHRDVLRSTPLKFRFVFSTPDGRQNLKQACRDAGLGDVSVQSLLSSEDVHQLEGLAGDDAEALSAFLGEVGEELLRATKGVENPVKWTADRIANSRLGYGNGGLLVVQQNNCPTSTVTALWASGTFRGVRWRPLFPRRSSDL